jgi:hypothetical protein
MNLKADHALLIRDGLIVSPSEAVCGASLRGATLSASAYSVTCRECQHICGVLDERTEAQKRSDLDGALWRMFTR